ncbi:MAG: heme ABC exporter ATP-binding protein CcmA [Paracoccaceae bacterium]
MTLTVSDLTCTRSTRTIFSGMSFAVHAGEAVLLRGPNGAGKSTLLRVLAGMIPAEGRIDLNGQALADGRDAVQEQITYAGHLDAIKPQLTVGENLAFWARLFDGDTLVGAKEKFALADIWDRPAHACSAGQKRRLGLARLLVTKRPLWLLDEPTVSLDTATVTQFAKIVTEHCAQGGMALIATHIDLGLDSAREIHMPADQTGTPPSNDPFLSGDWA